MIILLQAIICSYLWRLAGKGGFKGARYVRYIGVPLVMMLSLKLSLLTLTLLALRIGGMFLSGYGYNSPIRDFFRHLFKSDGKCTQLATRFVNGLLWTVPGVVIGVSMWIILLQSVIIAIIGAYVTDDVISECGTGFIVGLQ